MNNSLSNIFKKIKIIRVSFFWNINSRDHSAQWARAVKYTDYIFTEG